MARKSRSAFWATLYVVINSALTIVLYLIQLTPAKAYAGSATVTTLDYIMPVVWAIAVIWCYAIVVARSPNGLRWLWFGFVGGFAIYEGVRTMPPVARALSPTPAWELVLLCVGWLAVAVMVVRFYRWPAQPISFQMEMEATREKDGQQRKWRRSVRLPRDKR